MVYAFGRPSSVPTNLLKLHELAMAVDNNGSRSQASKMFDLAMDLDEQVSHMMNELEQVQDTLAKLLALYPESLSYALTWTTPTDSPRFKNLERQRLYIFR